MVLMAESKGEGTNGLLDSTVDGLKDLGVLRPVR